MPDIKVSVNTTTLTPNANGTISAGTNASTSYATAANVANAINNFWLYSEYNCFGR